MASGGDFNKTAIAVSSILETLDKKPPKAITKFQTPCSEGESTRDSNLFVSAIQASLQPLCPTTKLPPWAAV